MGAVAGVLPQRIVLVASRTGYLLAVLTFSDVNGPIDLTGFSVRMQLRPAPGSPVLLLDLSSSATTQNGSAILLPASTAGVVEVYITNADLLALPLGTPAYSPVEFAYDIVMTEPGGDYAPWVYGGLIVTQGTPR